MRNRRNKRRVAPTFKQNTKLVRPDANSWPPIRIDDLLMSPIDTPEGGDPG